MDLCGSNLCYSRVNFTIELLKALITPWPNLSPSSRVLAESLCRSSRELCIGAFSLCLANRGVALQHWLGSAARTGFGNTDKGHLQMVSGEARGKNQAGFNISLKGLHREAQRWSSERGRLTRRQYWTDSWSARWTGGFHETNSSSPRIPSLWVPLGEALSTHDFLMQGPKSPAPPLLGICFISCLRQQDPRSPPGIQIRSRLSFPKQSSKF